MKKIISIFLILLLLAQLGIYHFVYIVRQHHLKKEMMAFLRTHPRTGGLVHFDFDVYSNGKGPEWEGDKEFTFEGKMYDVVQIQRDSAIHVDCISDENETALVSSYQSWMKGATNGSEQSGNNDALFFSLLYCEEPHPVQASFFCGASQYYSFDEAAGNSPFREVLNPPPACLPIYWQTI